MITVVTTMWAANNTTLIKYVTDEVIFLSDKIEFNTRHGKVSIPYDNICLIRRANLSDLTMAD